MGALLKMQRLQQSHLLQSGHVFVATDAPHTVSEVSTISRGTLSTFFSASRNTCGKWTKGKCKLGELAAEDIIADMINLKGAAGSVVTYSSNVGRALYWINYAKMISGEFMIESLDRSMRLGRWEFLDEGAPPDPGFLR